MTSTEPTVQIRSDNRKVRSHPLRDGIHDEGLDLEAIQTNESHNPNDRDHGPQLLKPTRYRRPRGGYQLLYDALGNQETITKTTTEGHVTQDGW
jgi:type II restriction/modification system DNA methylase subunit YeeA